MVNPLFQGCVSIHITRGQRDSRTVLRISHSHSFLCPRPHTLAFTVACCLNIRYDVVLTKVGSSPPSPPPMPTCAAPMVGMDAGSATRAAKSPEGYKASSQTDCCAKCSSDPSCIATIYEPASASSSSAAEISAVGDVPNANCWPLSKVTQLVATPHRTFACMDPAKCITPSTVVTMPDFVVTSTAGAVLFNSYGHYLSAFFRLEGPDGIHQWSSRVR